MKMGAKRLVVWILAAAAVAGIGYSIKTHFGSPAPEIVLLKAAAEDGSDAIRKIALSTNEDEERRARLLLDAAKLQARRLEDSNYPCVRDTAMFIAEYFELVDKLNLVKTEAFSNQQGSFTSRVFEKLDSCSS